MGALCWVMSELCGGLQGHLVSPWTRHGAGHPASQRCGDKGPIQASACAAAAFGCSGPCGGQLGSGTVPHMQPA